MSYEKSLLKKAMINRTPPMSVQYPLPGNLTSLEKEERELVLVASFLNNSLDVEIHEMSGRQHLFSDERHFDAFDPFEHEDAIHKIVSEVLK